MPPTQRMTLASFLDGMRREAAYFEELGRRQALTFHFQNDDLCHSIRPGGLSPVTEQRLRTKLAASPDELFSTWFRGEMAARGPKVFRPTLHQCLTLEQITVDLPLANYAQPYPAMAVELPEAYRQARACATAHRLYTGVHTPEYVLIGCPPGDVPVLLLQVEFSSNAFRTAWTQPSAATIEESIVRVFGADSYIAFGALSSEERLVAAGALRLAVNAMLWMMDRGCKHLGPANQSHYRRLQHYLEVARKRGEGVAEAQRDLRLAPQVYGFDQEIVLYEVAHEHPAGPGGETGAVVRPHWRQGHWKMQPCGPGGSQRKRILIKPVLVNKRRLLGGDGDFQTIYRIK